jgi:FkbM family methyltransferase
MRPPLTHRLRDGLAQLGARAGLTIVPTWRLDRLPMATHLRRLFARLDIDCVLDIVSFEPIPEHADAMRRRAANDPLWQIEAIALGDAPGSASFNIMAGSQFSSFLAPVHDEVDLFQRHNAVTRTITVPVSTVAAVIEDLTARVGLARPYLKLDTQGFDLSVLAGAGDAIARIPALQSEAAVRRIYDGAPDYTTALRDIESLGFVLSGIFPNNDGHFPRLIEFDCVFVARAALPA